MEILARFNGRNGEMTVAQERWPAAGAEDAGPRLNALKGYNALAWTAGGINYWAVSDSTPRVGRSAKTAVGLLTTAAPRRR